jgi:Recombinase zinc beta ribbon domain
MSLSARDRQALGSIQDQITGSDPQLASLMTMFTRLASGEEMPALEDIRAGGPRPRARAAAGRTTARTPCALSRRTRRRLSRQPALYLLWLTVAITLITVTLAINCGSGSGTGSCTQSWAGLGACAGQVPTDSPRPGLHRQVQRWNLPEGWVISRHPADPALVSDADFIAAQQAGAPRGPAGHATRQYLLAGLLACGRCGRRQESAWSNGRPAYRCRRGHPSAARPDPGRPKNTYIGEDQILPHLAAMALLLAGDSQARGTSTVQVTAAARTAGLIDQLRASGAVLTYDPDTRTIHTDGSNPVAVTSGQNH